MSRRALFGLQAGCATILIALALAPCGASAQKAPTYPTHEMSVALDPDSGRLEVTDRISLPDDLRGEGLEFLLNSALEITSSEPAVSAVPIGEQEEFFGINGTSLELRDEIDLTRYRLGEAPADGVLTLTYSGDFDFGLSDQKEEYTRGFRETVGVIGEEGVYLAGSGFWYPYLTDDLIEFRLDVEQPEGWQVISQGNGSARDASGRAHWDSAGPMDEIYLVGGPLEVYSDAAGAVEALVYLHERDDALAAKYLTATAQYIEMYRELIGPYPYEKFALVENFWETGYGMPSFTLLGPSIIRFPFILHLVLPPRDPPQLVGQLGLRRLQDRELVRGAHRLSRRPPDPGTARQGRRLPAGGTAEVPRFREGGSRLPAGRVPISPQRGDRGRRLRQDPDGLPCPAAVRRRRRVP